MYVCIYVCILVLINQVEETYLEESGNHEVSWFLLSTNFEEFWSKVILLHRPSHTYRVTNLIFQST